MKASLLVAVVADPIEETAVRIAREAGARGVTILPAGGIGFPEHVTFFGLTFTGFMKTLLWVLDADSAARLAERLNRELDLIQPFQGLAFCLPIESVCGFDPDAVHASMLSGS